MLTPKKIFIQGIWWRKKNSCCSKIPHPPPRNFSNGPSLSAAEIQAGFISNQYLFRAFIQIMVRAHNDQF